MNRHFWLSGGGGGVPAEIIHQKSIWPLFEEKNPKKMHLAVFSHFVSLQDIVNQNMRWKGKNHI